MTSTPQKQFRSASMEYLTNAVMTATPEKLVVLLYDGAIQSLDAAADAFDRKRRAEAGTQVSRALSIVGELRASLNLEEGKEVARDLFALYGFITNRITRGNAEKNSALVREARQVMSTLREGWDGIARRN